MLPNVVQLMFTVRGVCAGRGGTMNSGPDVTLMPLCLWRADAAFCRKSQYPFIGIASSPVYKAGLVDQAKELLNQKEASVNARELFIGRKSVLTECYVVRARLKCGLPCHSNPAILFNDGIDRYSAITCSFLAGERDTPFPNRSFNKGSRGRKARVRAKSAAWRISPPHFQSH
ncbi:hypothetical protein [Mesorhizobium sp.]|uniref:hypothetical protein n=1 Tax=Mesorhizobium sp. TaxID=1871066 RepID=UPI000FE4A410|nr:hypothetical protein [Mesorhizobium sp.]RWO52038.1 MAG: hypothetical protein EOS13_17265 [Mesorhizobium sp.]TIN28006.1 MAG: hypothetical protein E5Y19_08290 [Mesorhizobium sp.]TIN39582.1 MAG: hypothetical protein E5Y13_12040 [Mesorhizobium sp.]TJU78655.1 MAG: hypothetical protein E5Y15_25115 [Mesorhizobium sp.]TJU90293.1 MAG: hypothetical protein E5Y10_11660 [Mesorhizobium sp.]